MFALTEKLLRGSLVTPASHPLLVGLLEMAAQRPGVTLADEKLAKRIERDWHAVRDEFRACHAVGITDADLRAALPLPGVRYSEKEGWTFEAFDSVMDSMGYRRRVAAALRALARSKGGRLQAFAISSIGDLRKAQRVNGIPDVAAVIPLPRARIETGLLPGRRLVVSCDLYGRRVFTALQADEFGRVSVISHAMAKRLAVAACSDDS